MTRLIIITAVRFLACKNQIQLVILEYGDLGHQTGSFGPIEGSHLTSQVQGSQHAAMLGGKLSVAGGLGTFTHMFALGNFAQLYIKYGIFM